MKIKVSIVEDDRIVGEALLAILCAKPEFESGGLFISAEQALKELPDIKPDVILMDMHLPGMSGIECLKRIKDSISPRTKIIMLTSEDSSHWMKRAIQAGAEGYLIKGASPAEILLGIKNVFKGGGCMSGIAARTFFTEISSSFAKQKKLGQLTHQEHCVLDLMSVGLSNKMIADRMGISVETARTHARNIYKKLGVCCRTEAAAAYLDAKVGTDFAD